MLLLLRVIKAEMHILPLWDVHTCEAIEKGLGKGQGLGEEAAMLLISFSLPLFH